MSLSIRSASRSSVASSRGVAASNRPLHTGKRVVGRAILGRGARAFGVDRRRPVGHPLEERTIVDDQIIGLSVRLAEAAARNTAAGIADRLDVLRTRKDAREAVGQLEEIINDLIADKMELLQIARAFEEDLVAQRITPEQAAALVNEIGRAHV